MGWSDQLSGADNRRKKNIFISYRVNDTAGETGRLVDSLKQYFDEDQIFMDIDKIEPGVDFTEVISKSLGSCDVLLAIIGPNWLGTRDTQQAPRIHQPNDWVRLEISSALQRNIRVVPVLVDGAELPLEQDLPADLQPLLKRQAYEISNKRWKYDTEQLVRFLVKLGITPKPSVYGTAASKKEKRTWWAANSWWVFTLCGFMLAILIGLSVSDSNADTANSKNNPPANNQSRQTTDNTQTQNTYPVNNTQSYDNSPAYTGNDVSGIWIEQDAQPSVFEIVQNGNSITARVYMNNQLLSEGVGTIDNRNVLLKIDLLGVVTQLNLTLSPDKMYLNGNYFVQITGDTQPIKLKKQPAGTAN